MASRPRLQLRPAEASAPGLAVFRDAHRGEAIIVCGCGPSLKELADAERHTTIGVNDVGRLFDPTYLVVVNPRSQFKADRFAFVERSKAQFLFTQLDLGCVRPPVVRFKLGRFGGTDVCAGDALHYTQNSPYVAVCLAAYMGAHRIGLIGVDLTDGHFFAPTGRHPLAGRVREIDEQYHRLAVALASRGVELVNLSSVSRLTSLPKCAVPHLTDPLAGSAALAVARKGLRIVSYATTPVAGVPAVLARCIDAATADSARCVWAADGYGNAVQFAGDVQWNQNASSAIALLEAADLVIVHNGKVTPQHRRILASKPVVTMAHNYGWNVDLQFVTRGYPGVVVGQYQATLPEFAHWSVVPNPIPLWEPAYSPGPKGDPITIAFTPSGRHERYPRSHRLYWHSKGFDTTMRVLERLAGRSSVRLETTLQGQVSHDQALAMKRRAHIVIDECVTGSYHRNSLEGLAAGCVVVNGVGLLPGVREALLRCAGDCPDWLFVRATLDELEPRLDELMALGADQLHERGRRSRAWMDSHWSFKAQWDIHWRPVIERALDRTRPGMRIGQMKIAESTVLGGVAPQQRAHTSKALSVIVPFGGADRLGPLAAAVAGLCQSTALDQLIIVELGTQPLALDIARRWATDYLFIPCQSAFDKARAVNVGTTVAKNAELMWCDGDLVFAPDFLSRAQQEFRDGRSDFFFPFSRIEYLAEADSSEVQAGTRNPADCRAVSVLRPMHGGAIGGVGMVRAELLHRWGGMLEGFLGWGGEDNAWVHKASLVGRVGVTQRKDQVAYHLHHPGSSATGGQPWRSNANYQRNVALLAEVQRIRTAAELARRFPVPKHWPTPWPAMKQVCFLAGEAGSSGSLEGLARSWAQQLYRLYGMSVPILTCGAAELDSACPALGVDAIVAFGSDAAVGRALAERALLGRTIVVLQEGEPAQDLTDALTDAAWLLAHDVEQGALLRSRGLSVWHVPSGGTPREGHFSAPVVVQPLSVLLADNRTDAASSLLPGRLERADQELPVWVYWEGPMPDWISSCLETIRMHAPTLRMIGPSEFDKLRDRDRDLDLSTLHVAQRADFVRAFLLMRFGGLWIDADCIVLHSLTPLLARWREYDFVAHRERQGLFSNAFMAAARDSVVAQCLYSAVCERLRSRRRLTWIALGNELLTEVLNTTPARWLELKTEQIQPVCWSRPEVYFQAADEAHHARRFDSDALCYMLSQQNVIRFQQSRRRAPLLTAERSFFSFLLRRARAGAESAPRSAPSKTTLSEVFERMRQEHSAQGHESVSGPGSSLMQTAEVRRRLPLLLQGLGVRVLLDAPCGDFNWMRSVRLGVETYIGGDLLEGLIQQNRERYMTSRRHFLVLDLEDGALPAADVVLCRDYLVHLPFADIARVVRNIAVSGSRYLLTTTFPGRPSNAEIQKGQWRPLNLEAAPFSFPTPLRLINEKCTESAGAFSDKSLGLWRLADLPL